MMKRSGNLARWLSIKKAVEELESTRKARHQTIYIHLRERVITTNFDAAMARSFNIHLIGSQTTRTPKSICGGALQEK
jgi:hypothetical protein